MDLPELPGWMAGDKERLWHAPVSGGYEPEAECGHRIQGRVHARRGVYPPQGDGRSMCPACAIRRDVFWQAPVDLLRPLEEAIARVVFVAPELIKWPDEDFDEVLLAQAA
ncbi:hypothetical protein HUO13_02445 [Saccharopolyspora erythraea]|uniref:hypothetical protein n=1 Tax=Saccharopolyspora erythraea TaxID=1836 RepID=UPI001BADA111|nr:hypothetical protein [Saccharopolyspora erythraea]QUG99811.1 hypothetical protein HUO13_02445 [Saccharopolyspora erythraea]